VTAPANSERLRILIVGVGGQGVLTTSRVLGDAAMDAGLDVVLGQLHGMAQRGGSVEATVVIGPGRSAFVGGGDADIVLGFEPLETLRALPKMRLDTTVFLNRGTVVPFLLTQRGGDYPDLEEVFGSIRTVATDLHVLDGPAAQAEVGLPRALGAYLVGALSASDLLPMDEAAVWASIEQRTASGHLDAVRRAFEIGTAAIATDVDKGTVG